MQNLIGVFDCRVDEKGRVMFPSTLKKRLQSISEEGFIIKKSLIVECLEIFPMSEWNKLVNFIERQNQFQKDVDEFKRYFMYSHREVNLDGSGRFLIPKDLIDLIGLGKDVVLASSVNKIELWDKVKYENEMRKPIDYEKLSNFFLGNTRTE